MAMFILCKVALNTLASEDFERGLIFKKMFDFKDFLGQVDFHGKFQRDFSQTYPPPLTDSFVYPLYGVFLKGVRLDYYALSIISNLLI
jgi:hypothetical protein